jgi:hypothetical protein
VLNDAPVLDNTKSPTLTAQNEDCGAPSGAVGTLVSSLVDFASPSGQVDNVTDADSGALLGIAVTAADATNGTWYYSTNNGTTWNALGTPSAASSRLLAADANTRLYFQPNANYNGTLASAVTFRAWDQTSGINGALVDTTTNGGTTAFSTATDTASLVINAVNDAPVRTAGSPPAINVSEDSANSTAVTLGMSGLTYGVGGGSDETGQTLTYTVTVIPAHITLWLADGTTQVTASSTVTLAQLQGLKYKTVANANGSGNLSWTVQDSGGTANGGVDSLTENLAITVTAVNDAPVVTTTGSTLAYTENAAATAIDTGLTVSDVDSANLSGATVTISANYANGQDVLAFTNQLGITGSWSAASGILTLTGTTTVANYQAALRTVTYVNTSDNPSTSTRTISFVVNDGAANSSAATRSISVTAVNDAPVNSVPGAQSAAVNTPKVFSTANGNAISVSDVDAGTAAIQVQLTATNGTVTLGSVSGLLFSVGDGTTDATVTFTAPMSAINSALNGLSFSPTANWAGAASLQIVTDDLGNTGTGGPQTDTDSVTINVINTPPTGVVDAYTVLENNGLAVAAPGVLGNDTDPDPQTLGVGVPRPVSGPSHGSLNLNADGSFTYTPTTNWSGTDSFTYVVTDGMATSAATTVTITVTDTAYTPSGTWPVSFNTGRYLAVTFPAYVPAGSTVIGATFTHTYRSETAGDTTCYYFDVYQGGTLVATHGSAGSPVSCNGSTGWVTDVVPLPEINSVARANALTVKMYVSNSGARRSQHRLMTIGTTYYLG